MGKKVMKKMVAMMVAAVMIMVSGLAVFAADPSSPAPTPPDSAKKDPTQVSFVDTHATYKSKSMKVYWAASENADYYIVYLNGVAATGKITGTSANLTGLTDRAQYDVTVVGYSNDGKAGTASVAQNLTMTKRWIKDTKIKKIKKGKKKATITWKKVKGATGYQILYSKDGKTWKSKFIKGGKKTKATIKKLKKGKWQFRVRPVKGNYLGIHSKTKTAKIK